MLSLRVAKRIEKDFVISPNGLDKSRKNIILLEMTILLITHELFFLLAQLHQNTIGGLWM